MSRPGLARNTKTSKVISYSLLGILAVITLFPLFWMFSTSLKSLQEISVFPPVMFPPQPRWDNYVDATTFVPFGRYAINTVVIAVFYIIGNLLSASLVGYGFARLRFPGRNILFTVMISTLLMPLIVRLVPLFLLYKQLGWLNTPLPLIAPGFFGEAFFIYLMYQYFRSIPQELIDAARIDGASEVAIWLRIMVPLSVPALVAIAIFAFQRSWNDFLAPLVFLTKKSSWTLSLGLVSFTGGTGESVAYWHYLMAMSTMMVAPMIIIFLFAQRYFVQGVITSGMKG